MSTLADVLREYGWTVHDPDGAVLRASRTNVEGVAWDLAILQADPDGCIVVAELRHPERENPLVVRVGCDDEEALIDVMTDFLAAQDQIGPSSADARLSTLFDEHPCDIEGTWRPSVQQMLLDSGWQVDSTDPVEAQIAANSIHWRLRQDDDDRSLVFVDLTRDDVPGNVSMWLQVGESGVPGLIEMLSDVAPACTPSNYDNLLHTYVLTRYPGHFGDAWLKPTVGLQDMSPQQRERRDAFVQACRATGWTVDEGHEEMVRSDHITLSPQAMAKHGSLGMSSQLEYHVGPDLVEVVRIDPRGNATRMQAWAGDIARVVEGFAFLVDARGLLGGQPLSERLPEVVRMLLPASRRLRISTDEGWAELSADGPIPELSGAGGHERSEGEAEGLQRTGSRRLDEAALRLVEAGWQVTSDEDGVRAEKHSGRVSWSLTVCFGGGDWYVMHYLSDEDRKGSVSFDLTTRKGKEVPGLIEESIEMQGLGVTSQNYESVLLPRVFAHTPIIGDTWLKGEGVALGNMTSQQRQRYDEFYARAVDLGWTKDESTVEMVETDGHAYAPEVEVRRSRKKGEAHLKHHIGADYSELQVFLNDDTYAGVQVFAPRLDAALPLLTELADAKPGGSKAHELLGQVARHARHVRIYTTEGWQAIAPAG